MTSAGRRRAEADAARASMLANLQQLKQRLSPSLLMNDAVENAREKAASLADRAADSVRARPAAVGAAVGATLLFLASKPICRLFRRKPRTSIPASIEGTDHD